MVLRLDEAEQQTLREGGARLGITIDDAFLDRVGRYLGVLELWGRRFRLTGERARSVLLRKHIVDALALGPLLPTSGPVIDIGSGAGFPGVVVACLRPDLAVVLVEARRRKASFLAEVTRTVPLPEVHVVNARAEDLVAEWSRRARLITGRALRIEQLLPLALPLLAPGGKIVAMQTPRQRARAAELAARCGLALVRIRPYELLDGESRALFVFRRVSRETSLC